MKGSIMRSAFGQFCAESKKRAERTFHPLSRSVQKSAVGIAPPEHLGPAEDSNSRAGHRAESALIPHQP